MPCHVYADNIPILFPGEHRRHHDWCHAVSPSTCLGTWQKYILSNMKHAHFMETYCSTESRVLPKPNSILQISTLFFIRRRRKKAKRRDKNRTARCQCSSSFNFSKVCEIWESKVGLGWVGLESSTNSYDSANRLIGSIMYIPTIFPSSTKVYIPEYTFGILFL